MEKFLAMLGMPEEKIIKWCAKNIVEDPKKPDMMTSLDRWHIKALTSFGFATSLADIAAVIVAMSNWPKEQSIAEDQLVLMIDEFAKRVEAKNFDGVWIPDIHGLDGEKDDRMALGVIQYARFCMGLPPAKSIWQFPPQLRDYAVSFAWSGHTAFVDDKANNAQSLISQLL